MQKTPADTERNGEIRMSKKLSEMTLEELWQLFPIFLTEHQPQWKEWYREEEALLLSKLQGIARISHIGSTAIRGIWAKPIIDILLEVPEGTAFSDYKASIQAAGYICMAERTDSLSFNKGYTENGFAQKVFHLHLRPAGRCDELYFRDYLNEHADIAAQYESLKLTLWKEHEHDRVGYTNAKSEFVRRVTETAKALYGDRY